MENKRLSQNRILSRKEPEKGLLSSFKDKAGRGSSGTISVRHQGGGVKRLYRIVDFGQGKLNVAAKVLALEYDPYRTAFLALLEYEDKGGKKERSYIIAPCDIKAGDEIICSEKVEIKNGNRGMLKNLPVGTLVNNIELIPGLGGKMARSAGSYAKVLAHEGDFTNLEMPSAEIRKVSENCYATIGAVSRPEWRYSIAGKAGYSRRKGIRPRVRGTAMNPCDHPHGGGEGRTPRGMKYPKTPWGKHALGVKTRKHKWTDQYIISRRKKKEKAE